MNKKFQNYSVETVGISGNKVNIPGLTKDNSEKLKMLILEQMKKNPVDENSGL